MAITKQKKEEILKDLIDKFGRSKSIVFANYRGLDVASISELRSELRKENAEMKVAKKTLIGLAAKDTVGELDSSVMEGPIVATFSYEDPLSGIRILFKFSKKNENLKLLGGVIDGKMVGPDIIKQYAKIPSREELLAKLISSMNSPISGFVGIGNSLIGGIVRALSAYKDTMPAESAPAPTAPEPAPATEEKPVEPEAEEKVEVEVEKEKPAEAPPADEPTPVEESEKEEDKPQSEQTESGEATEDSAPAETAPEDEKPA